MMLLAAGVAPRANAINEGTSPVNECRVVAITLVATMRASRTQCTLEISVDCAQTMRRARTARGQLRDETKVHQVRALLFSATAPTDACRLPSWCCHL